MPPSNKAIGNLSETAETLVDRVNASAKRFASLVRHWPDHSDMLYRVVCDLDSVKGSL